MRDGDVAMKGWWRLTLQVSLDTLQIQASLIAMSLPEQRRSHVERHREGSLSRGNDRREGRKWRLKAIAEQCHHITLAQISDGPDNTLQLLDPLPE